MNNFPTSLENLTLTEGVLWRIAMAHRSSKGRFSQPDQQHLRLRVEGALRGGPIYSPYALFTDDPYRVAEWLIMLMSGVTEDTVPRFKASAHKDIEAALKAARQHFEAALSKDIAQTQLEYDQDPEGFRDWNRTAIVEDGIVLDPWGYNYVAMCRWMLDNMTPMGIFAFYYAVSSEVAECQSEGLAAWAFGDSQTMDPRKVAEKKFNEIVRNLSNYLETILTEQATEAEWNQHPLAP